MAALGGLRGAGVGSRALEGLLHCGAAGDREAHLSDLVRLVGTYRRADEASDHDSSGDAFTFIACPP
jgi:hypothetical protein